MHAPPQTANTQYIMGGGTLNEEANMWFQRSVSGLAVNYEPALTEDFLMMSCG